MIVGTDSATTSLDTGVFVILSNCEICFVFIAYHSLSLFDYLLSLFLIVFRLNVEPYNKPIFHTSGFLLNIVPRIFALAQSSFLFYYRPPPHRNQNFDCLNFTTIPRIKQQKTPPSKNNPA